MPSSGYEPATAYAHDSEKSEPKQALKVAK